MTVVAIIRGHAVGVPARELSDADAHRVTKALARSGIRVEPVVSVWGVVHLWAKTPMSTYDEVFALRAFAEVTDCRLAWHKAEA